MRWVIVTLGLILCLSVTSLAQQSQKPGRSLTNEDFPSGQRVDNVDKEKVAKEKDAAEAKDSKDSKEAKGDKAEKSDKADKSDKNAKSDKSDKGDKADKSEKGDKADKVADANADAKKKAEEDWQKKNAESQKKLSDLDREKTAAELRAQELRQKMRDGGSDPTQFQELSEELKSAESRLHDANSKYDEAKKEADGFKSQADEKGFKEPVKAEIPKVDKDGRPNREYYTKNYSELSERQRAAEERLQLFQSRLNEARQRAYQGRSVEPTRVGNPYFTDPEVKKAYDEAQTELQKAQQELEQTNQELDKLNRDAKSSGVPINR